jgi:phage-related protein/uncharacterized protein YoxC
MADNFGLKIGVEGEKAFKQALSEINQSFKVLGSEMQLVTSQFDKNDKSAAALTARNTVLNKEIDTQKDKISTLKAALDNSSASFGENDKRTQNWQIQLNKAQAELNGMERELGENEKALDGMGDEMQDAAKETDKLGDELDDTGKTADDAGGKFEKLGSVVKGIGVAIGAAMAAIGAATVAAGKALYDMANEAAAAGDRVDKASQKLGLSAEAYQEWDYVLSQNGASIDSLGAGMKALQNTMAGLTEDGDKSSEAFKRIGIDFDDIKNKSPEEAFDMTVKALQNMPPGAEKTAAAMKLLGKQGMELMPLLNQTAEETDALRQKAHDLGMVMSEEAVAASVKYTDSVDTLKRSFTGIKNSIGAELLPGMTMIADAFTGLITGQEGAGEALKAGAEEIVKTIGDLVPRLLGLVNSIVSSVAEVAPDIISSLVTAIVDNLPAVIDAAVSIITTLLGGIVEALPQLTAGALQLVLSLVEGILNNLPAILEAAIQVVVTLVQGISDALPKLIPAIVQAVVTMVQALIDNLPMILDAALQLVLGLTQGILDALPQLIAALPAIILGIVDFIIGAIPQIIDAGIQLLVSLVEALPEIITAIVAAIPQIIEGLITAILGSIPQLIDAGIKLLISLVQNLPQIIVAVVAAIPQIITSLITAIIGSIPQIIQAGIELFISLIKNLPTIIVEVVKAIPQIITAIVKGFTDNIGKIVQVGSDLIKGLWQGISNVADWIWGKISGFFGGIVSGIKNFFGIKSPSTLFAGLGENMGQGIGVGFERAMDQVSEDMQDAIPTDFDMPGINADGSAHGGGFGGSLITIQQMIVRSEDDIRRISQELYNLMQTGSRAQGRFSPA